MYHLYDYTLLKSFLIHHKHDVCWYLSIEFHQWTHIIYTAFYTLVCLVYQVAGPQFTKWHSVEPPNMVDPQ